MDAVHQQIDELVKTNEVLLFMKGNANFPQLAFQVAPFNCSKHLDWT